VNSRPGVRTPARSLPVLRQNCAVRSLFSVIVNAETAHEAPCELQLMLWFPTVLGACLSSAVWESSRCACAALEEILSRYQRRQSNLTPRLMSVERSAGQLPNLATTFFSQLRNDCACVQFEFAAEFVFKCCVSPGVGWIER
jgi:hypothetical protein